MNRHIQRRPFGWTHAPVAIIGQGTWNMERDDRKAAIAALRAGLDAGMTHIDTAEIYGSGQVEDLVAEAIAGRRDDVFLVSKVWPQNASYSPPGRTRLPPEGTVGLCHPESRPGSTCAGERRRGRSRTPVPMTCGRSTGPFRAARRRANFRCCSPVRT